MNGRINEWFLIYPLKLNQMLVNKNIINVHVNMREEMFEDLLRPRWRK